MMSLELAARMAGAELRGSGTLEFDAVSTDTRSLADGSLFVALRGEHFDGHGYLETARVRGAIAAMVDGKSGAESGDVGLPLLVVDDTRAGLARLAAQWRRRFPIPVIAVVGSNGKTTVKEMAAAILRAHHPAGHPAEKVLVTQGNLNNDIGLPLTLLRLREEHVCAVVEIGMNHPGETGELAPLAAPTIGVINNAQREHQEFMCSVEAVALEHAALLESIAVGGVAVINADDAHAALWREAAHRRGLRVRDFGIERAAAVTATYSSHAEGASIDLGMPEGYVRVELHAFGEHNVRNALAAAAAATAAGAGIEAVARGLGMFRPVKGRLERKRGRRGATLLDDTYNANPDSVRAAIDVLAGATGTRILVLGDMGEVGARGPEFHAEIGRYARERGIERLFAVGKLARAAAQAFGKAAVHFDAAENLAPAIIGDLGAAATVLVKGSRFMRMERVVEALEAPACS